MFGNRFFITFFGKNFFIASNIYSQRLTVSLLLKSLHFLYTHIKARV